MKKYEIIEGDLIIERIGDYKSVHYIECNKLEVIRSVHYIECNKLEVISAFAVKIDNSVIITFMGEILSVKDVDENKCNHEWYEPEEYNNKIIKSCKKCGCKNVVLQKIYKNYISCMKRRIIMSEYQEMYGDMNKDEIELIYKHLGNYKGWTCAYTGYGTVIMQKGSTVIRTFRDEDVKDWIPQCWNELKEKINELEDESDKEIKDKHECNWEYPCVMCKEYLEALEVCKEYQCKIEFRKSDSYTPIPDYVKLTLGFNDIIGKNLVEVVNRMLELYQTAPVNYEKLN